MDSDMPPPPTLRGPAAFEEELADLRARVFHLEKLSSRIARVEANLQETTQKLTRNIEASTQELRAAHETLRRENQDAASSRTILGHAVRVLEQQQSEIASKSKRGVIGQVVTASLGVGVQLVVLLRLAQPAGAHPTPTPTPTPMVVVVTAVPSASTLSPPPPPSGSSPIRVPPPRARLPCKKTTS